MSKWCIVSASALIAPSNEALQELADGFCDIGVVHDGKNHVFTSLPPSINNHAVHEIVVTGEESEMQLIKMVGVFLSTPSDTILIADSGVLTAIFNTTLHRLWCDRYESEQSFLADYQTVFGEYNLDDSRTLKERGSDARNNIFNLVNAL